MDRAHLEKFLSWYCPSWLSDYINSFASREWIPPALNYGYLMDLFTRGFIQPRPELIAKTLVPFVFEQDYKNRQTFFRPERLEQYDITLKEHLWHLFEYETTIHFSNRYLFHDGKKIQKSWMDVFHLYVGNGKLNRERLLQEALLASNRNFNKNLSGWFADLFVALKPTRTETLSLQRELFNLFASPHSKVVTTSLQACKTIVDDPLFDRENFLGSTPLLLASSTKSIVTSTLQLLEKLAKQAKEKRAEITLLATGALVHKEDSLQSRAAKLIARYGDTKDEQLRQTILLYKDSLFSGARQALHSFLLIDEGPLTGTEEEISIGSFATPPKGGLSEDTALPQIHSIDDLVFLASQAFDNNESWHMDLLPAAILQLQHQIGGEDIAKLEPAMQRALKLFFGDWRSNQGQLDYLLACFFLDCAFFFMEKFPAQTQSARTLVAGFMYKSEENKKVWQEHGTNTSFLASWKAEGDKVLYTAHTKLLNALLLCLKEGQTLPVFSTPTHAPAWIDPSALVERLSLHQAQNALPDDTDLQIALSRCWLHDTAEALQQAREKLTGEGRNLMLFLLDAEQRPAGPFTMEAAWMTAALSKSPGTIYPELANLAYAQKPRELYTGQYPFQIVSETYTYDKYNWDDGKMKTEKTTAQRQVIKFDFSVQKPRKEEPSGLKKFFSKWTGAKKEEVVEPATLLYDYLRIPSRWLNVEERDIRRIYLLTPNNPEPLLALTIDKCLSDPAFYGETAKRFVVVVLQALHDTGPRLEEVGHLFIAACLLSPDKTAATFAAETWLRAVEDESLNHRQLGVLLGRLAAIEFAPLKRFTDLTVKNLLNVSPLHNKTLEQLLSAMLKELPEVPVKGLKRLLEIYLEVSRPNASGVQDEILKTKLGQWKENSTVAKVIKSVMV